MAARAGGTDLILPIAVLAMVGMLMFPLPSAVLDVLLICNITFSLTLLLSAVYLSEPERFTALPTVLLLSTLFRLGLNISTTRQLLANGQAPETVVTFGNFLVQGNLVVGAVLFAIITLVQFLVIAKGAERVAEVAARFTLDAMPGKQMSIDADIRAGLLSLLDAKQKRAALQRESKLYGALDGAMKFVKGDAIAGLCITVVNCCGGLFIGITQHKLSAAEALSRYTLYTVGDGLVSQIPALLVAVAAGIAVTRVSEDEHSFVGREVFSQIAREPQALAAASIVTALMACVPGLPALPFAGCTIVLGVTAMHRRRNLSLAEKNRSGTEFRPKLYSDVLLRLSPQAVLALQNLGTFADSIQRLRAEFFQTQGLLLPDVQFEIDHARAGLAAELEFRGNVLASIAPEVRFSSEASESGPQLNNSAQCGCEAEFADRITEALRTNCMQLRCEFCDDAATRQLLEVHRATSEELSNALIPDVLSVTELTAILRQLVREHVAVRDLRVILQAIAEHAVAADRGIIGENEVFDRFTVTQDVLRGLSVGRSEGHKSGGAEVLASVRVALKRTITRLVCGSQTELACWILDPELDADLARSEAAGLPLDPISTDVLGGEIAELSRATLASAPVVITSRFARMRTVRICAAESVTAHVICAEELLPGIDVNLLGVVSCNLPERGERGSEHVQQLQ